MVLNAIIKHNECINLLFINYLGDIKMNNISNLNAAMGLVQSNSVDENSGDGSWFEAMAEAWGQALDRQASRIETQSTQLGDQGIDSPAAITQLTAESLKMTFLSNSSHTALSSTGSALETMARKQ